MHERDVAGNDFARLVDALGLGLASTETSLGFLGIGRAGRTSVRVVSELRNVPEVNGAGLSVPKTIEPEGAWTRNLSIHTASVKPFLLVSFAFLFRESYGAK